MRFFLAPIGLALLVLPGATALEPGIRLAGDLAWSQPAHAEGLVLPAAEAGTVVGLVPADGRITNQPDLLRSDRVQRILHRWSPGSPLNAALDDATSRALAAASSRLLHHLHLRITHLRESPHVLWTVPDQPGSAQTASAGLTGAACELRVPPPGDRIWFPHDTPPGLPPWRVHAATPEQLHSACRAPVFQIRGSTSVFFYGMAIELVSDEGTETVTTGPLDPLPGTEPSEVPVNLLEIRWLAEDVVTEYRSDSEVEFHAEAVRVQGRLHVPASHGTLEWGSWNHAGALDAFDADGHFAVRRARESRIYLSGSTTTPPPVEATAVSAHAVPPWTPVLVSAAIGLGLAWLLLRVPWSLFSSLAPHRLLGHATRRRLVDLIQENPGVETGTLATALGLPWSLVEYHTRRLAREGHLAIHYNGGRRTLFPPHGANAARRDQVVLLRRGTPRRLFELINEAPGLDQAGLAARLGRHQSQVSRALRQLEAAGLIASERGARPVRYRLASEAATASAVPAPVPSPA